MHIQLIIHTLFMHNIIILLQMCFKLPDEEVIASWNNPTQSDSSWQATVQMAWQISAHLVFQLSVRYSIYVHDYTTCTHVHADFYLLLYICTSTHVHVLLFRFNQVDTVVREVANLVKNYPTAFIDIPEALQVTCVAT